MLININFSQRVSLGWCIWKRKSFPGIEGPGSCPWMGSGKYPPLWRRQGTGPSSKNDCSGSRSCSCNCSCSCSCRRSRSCFNFAFEVEAQVTIFGESAGGWSVSHQLVRSSFLIQLSSVLFVLFSKLECFSCIRHCFKCRSILRQKVYSEVRPFLGFQSYLYLS